MHPVGLMLPLLACTLLALSSHFSACSAACLGLQSCDQDASSSAWYCPYRDASSGNPLSPAVEQVRRRIRRRRRSCADPRNLLVLFTLISCLGTVLFVYSRTQEHLP